MVRRRAYPKYKDSGIEWLGEIPEHWEVWRLKHLTNEHLQYGANEAAEYSNPEWPRFIRITDINENGTLKDDTFRSLPRDVAKEYHLLPGDLLFARSGATVGKTFIYDESLGMACFAGYLIRFRSNLTMAYPKYIYLFTLSSLYQQWRNGVLIQATIQNISAEKYGSLPLPIPPRDEQRAIVSFLDRETARIDALVEKKERQIELLREKRSALISHVVTKGLNPDAPMKKAGIEWLGEIPEHWEVIRLKYLVEGGLVNGLFKKKEFFGNGIKLVNVFDVYRKDFFLDHESLDRVEADEAEQKKYAVQSGDIFFVRSSLKLEGVGRSVCAMDVKEPTVFECHIVRARPVKRMISPNFLIHFLNSIPVINRFISLANLVTMATIDQEKIKGLEVPLPPRDEQEEIMAVLNREIETIERLENTISKSITKYREYRTALISAAVTGKIDVRREAA